MLSDICADSAFILRILTKVVKIVRFAIPIILILLVSFDLFKVVTGADDKAKKEAMDKIVKRLIYAVIIFLVPTFVNLIFKTVDNLISSDDDMSTTPSTWIGCWNKIYDDPSYGTTYGSGNNYVPPRVIEPTYPTPNSNYQPTYPTPGSNYQPTYPTPGSNYQPTNPTPTAPGETMSKTYGCCYSKSDIYEYTYTYDKAECDSLRGFGTSQTTCDMLNDSNT